MQHPKRVGDRTTLAVMLALVAQGFDVSVPFGENTRYDLVVDRAGRLFRVQCKTGRLRDGAVRFATASTYGHLPSPQELRRSYAGEIDEFAVHCDDTQCVYILPIADVQTKATAHLRVEPSRNRQTRGVRRASDFHVATVHVASVQIVDGDAVYYA